MRDTTGGWTLEEEAAAGAIGGHAGTHRAEGFASGDTLGGTAEAARGPFGEPEAASDVERALETAPDAERMPEPQEA